MNKISKYFRLPWKEQLLLFEIFLLLCLAKLWIQFLPFRKIVQMIGQQHKESELVQTKKINTSCRKLRKYIYAIAKYLPWKSVCFDKAIVAKISLNRRRILSTIYFGVANSEKKDFQAHAWVRCGQVFVTGGEQHARFTVLSYFS